MTAFLYRRHAALANLQPTTQFNIMRLWRQRCTAKRQVQSNDFSNKLDEIKILAALGFHHFDVIRSDRIVAG